MAELKKKVFIFRRGTRDRKAITTLTKPQMTKEHFWYISQLNTDLTKHFILSSQRSLFLHQCSPNSMGHATKAGNHVLEAPLQFFFEDFQHTAQTGSSDNAQVLTSQSLLSVLTCPPGEGKDQAHSCQEMSSTDYLNRFWCGEGPSSDQTNSAQNPCSMTDI